MRLILCSMFLSACTIVEVKRDRGDDGDTGDAPSGIGALGHESHDISEVTLTEISSSSDGLDVPRDLEFSTVVEDELWVMNRSDDSATIITGAGTDEQSSRHVVDPYALHFMEEVSSIAFGAALYSGSDLPNFATCHESNNTYNNQAIGNNFMGPSLWSSDPDVFGLSNPDAVAFMTDLWGMYTDLGSHLDMLHETPMCMGIAWEQDNAYWAFNGQLGSIDYVDFQDDHDAGYDDHSDGIMGRYVEGEVSRVEDVPSHMVFDSDTAFLYIADTGNRSIKVLDTTTGEQGLSLPRMEPGTQLYRFDDALIWTLIDGDDHDLVQPSGLAMVDDILFVTDHATGFIHAFDLEGNLVDWLDTGLGEGALMGIEARSTDDLWIVDAKNDRILRLQP
jgi:hypothetical protein